VKTIDNYFKVSYVCNKVIVRHTKKYVVDKHDSLRNIDVLILCHEYDMCCFYVTVPIIFESKY